MTDDERTDKDWQVAWAVLRYLSAHPDAKDTLEGIARWWLQREWTERLFDDVQRAVDLLLHHDLLLETRRPGIPPYYQPNAEQRKAIVKVLEE